MTSVEFVANYLSAFTFKPHSLGNVHRYGLNNLNPHSVINVHGENWMFISYMNNDNAVYMNVHGNTFILEGYGNCEITRMEEEV